MMRTIFGVDLTALVILVAGCTAIIVRSHITEAKQEAAFGQNMFYL